MRLTKSQAKIVKQALKEWEDQKLLTLKESKKLATSLEIVPFDWRRLARYSFIIAIISILIAINSIIFDEDLMELIERIFDSPAGMKSLSFFTLSVLIFWFGVYNKKAKPHMGFRNEAILTLGVFAYAGGIYYGGEYLSARFNLASESYSALILYGCISYAILGYIFRSQLIWLFAVLCLGGWAGTKTGYISGGGAYFLGMNYPLRFVLFGALMTLGAHYLKHYERFKPFHYTTFVMGLLYLFNALWILSIFGNYGDIMSWYRASHIELFHWSFLFALVAIGSFVYGLKYDDATTRGFGLVFLFINLYTRFFEFFWNELHKGIFFSILALSLWYVGTKAETIWNLKIAPSSKDS